jgi:hypothetical protein
MKNQSLEEANQKAQRWISKLSKNITRYVSHDVNYFIEEAKEYRMVVVPDGLVTEGPEKTYCLPLSFFEQYFKGPIDVTSLVVHAIGHTRCQSWRRETRLPWNQIPENITELMEDMFNQRFFHVYAPALYEHAGKLIRVFDAYRPRVPSPVIGLDPRRTTENYDRHVKLYSLLTRNAHSRLPISVRGIHQFLYQIDPKQEIYTLYSRYWFGALQNSDVYAIASTYEVE